MNLSEILVFYVGNMQSCNSDQINTKRAIIMTSFVCSSRKFSHNDHPAVRTQPKLKADLWIAANSASPGNRWLHKLKYFIFLFGKMNAERRQMLIRNWTALKDETIETYVLHATQITLWPWINEIDSCRRKTNLQRIQEKCVVDLEENDRKESNKLY